MSFEYYSKFCKQFFITHDFNPNDSISDMERKYYYYIDKSVGIDNILVQKNLQRASKDDDDVYLSYHNSLYCNVINNNISLDKIKIKLKPILKEIRHNKPITQFPNYETIKTVFSNEFNQVTDSSSIEKYQFIKIINLYIKNNELQVDNDRKMISINNDLSQIFDIKIHESSNFTMSLFDFHKIVHVFWTNNI